MTDALAESVSLPRFRSLLMTTFAVAALLLAAIGIYGVVAYTVAQRTAEIGLRMALGATPSSVLAIVVNRGSRPVVVGIALGLAGAIGLTRLLETMLFGVTSFDTYHVCRCGGRADRGRARGHRHPGVPRRTNRSGARASTNLNLRPGPCHEAWVAGT